MGAHADRPSRAAWEEMEPTPPPGTHQHGYRLPHWIGRAILAMAAVQLLTLIGLGVGVVYLYQQQQFIEGRGEFRDREADRLEQAIDDALCDLLDQFPEGGLLDRPRAQYDCGPGLPLEEFPPEVQERFTPSEAPLLDRSDPLDRADRTRERQPPAKLPPAGGDAPAPPQQDAPPGPETGAPPPSEPVSPLDPITDPVCDATSVCLP